MRNVKKIFALLVLLALCVSLFTGCHGSRGMDAFSIPDEFDTSRDYEISFWAKNDTNLTQVEIYKQSIAEFEALYPNITVNLRLYTDYGKIYNDVITNIATQTTPNVCITYPDHIATYMTGNNIMVPLDELMNHPEYGLGGSKVVFDSPAVEEIVPSFLAECKLGESYYALPYLRSTEACYVNKTYVEALGYTLPEVLTWDFVFEVSEAAMATDEEGNYLVNGQKTMIPFIYKSTDNMMIQMLKQKGASYSQPDGSIEIFHETTRDILGMVAEHAKSGAFSTFRISSYPANFLNAGQCIFAVDSTAGATWMGSDAPLVDISDDKLVEFETVVMPPPQFDPENIQMISQGPSVCVFNKADPQEVMASWLFTQYLLTNNVQIAYSKTEGYVPVTTKAQNDPGYQDYLARSGEDNNEHYKIKIDAVKLMLEHVDQTFVTPVFNGSTSLRDASGQMIEEVAKGVRRGKTVDDAFIDDLFANMTSLYHLNQGNAVNTGEKADLGPLPGTAVVLLTVLGCVWLIMGGYVLAKYLKAKKVSRKG